MRDVFDLTGKVALITGASSGIGVEFARALAYRGADVAIFARRIDKLEETAKEVREFGHEVLAVSCDVTDESQIERAVKEVVDHFGKIDILVNNAGYCIPNPTITMTQEEWHRVIDVNLNGVFFMTKHVAPHMMAQNWGRIINIGSMYGLRANMFGDAIPHYYASKGAIPQLTRGWAQEFAKYNITVNAIAPGFFPSEIMPCDDNDDFNQMVKAIIPLGRPGKLEDMDGLITLLASDGAAYITGQTIPIDGGKTAV